MTAAGCAGAESTRAPTRAAGRRLRRGALSVVAVLAVLATPAIPIRAQTVRRPMSLIDLAELPRILDPQLSPDGRSLIYMLTRADWKANRSVAHIWRQSVSGSEPTQLTSGEAGEASGRWSPDSASLLFLTRGETETQIYLMPSMGGKTHALTHHDTAVSQAAWSPDGSAIYFLASDPPSADERDRDHLRDDIFAFEKNFRQRHLWRVA